MLITRHNVEKNEKKIVMRSLSRLSFSFTEWSVVSRLDKVQESKQVSKQASIQLGCK